MFLLFVFLVLLLDLIKTWSQHSAVVDQSHRHVVVLDRLD